MTRRSSRSVRARFYLARGAVEPGELWEVTDRGVNLDHLDGERKEKLDELFARVSLR